MPVLHRSGFGVVLVASLASRLACAMTAVSTVASYGGCYDETDHSLMCAFSPMECKNGTTFLTLAEVAGRSLTCGCEEVQVNSCYDVVDTHVATCYHNPGPGEGCPDTYIYIAPGYTFGADETQCTCHAARDTGYSEYGACYDTVTHNAVCSLSQYDCTDSENWLDPDEATNAYGLDCQCWDTYTGACHNPTTGEATCTYSAESCSTGQEWVTAREAEVTHGLGCRACESESYWASENHEVCHVACSNEGKDHLITQCDSMHKTAGAWCTYSDAGKCCAEEDEEDCCEVDAGAVAGVTIAAFAGLVIIVCAVVFAVLKCQPQRSEEVASTGPGVELRDLPEGVRSQAVESAGSHVFVNGRRVGVKDGGTF